MGVRVPPCQPYNDPKKWISIAKKFIDEGILIEKEDFTIAQLKNLKRYEEIDRLKQELQNKKKELRLQRENQHRQLVQSKLDIIKSIDTSKIGWVNKASKKLNISTTSVRRFLRLYAPEFERQTHFKEQTCFKKYQNSKDWKEYYRGKQK